MKPLLSVSRRTDIPAYYADWWLGAVRAGRCTVPNPVSGKPVQVPLAAEHWAGVVHWTRNAGPLLPHLDELDRHFGGRIAWQFTINGMPRSLEQRNPPVDLAVRQVRQLAARYGSRSVSWRFDPIVLTDSLGPREVLERFTGLAERLAGHAGRCITSFVDDYSKVRRNLERLEREQGVRVVEPDRTRRLELAGALADAAARLGLELHACCEDELLAVPGILKARCLDVGQLPVVPHGVAKWKPTRAECACHDSRDIGYYDSCPHGCIYCYANRNPELAARFHEEYRRAGHHLPMDKEPWESAGLSGPEGNPTFGA